MSKSPLDNTVIVKIKEVLSGNIIYQVPEYQRDYSWTKNQINDLLNDIEFVKNTSIEKYYFGPMVVHANAEQGIIIDGQQRLTSILLIYKIFKNIIFDLDPSEKTITRLNENLYKNGKNRLELGLTDEINFKKIMKIENIEELKNEFKEKLKNKETTNKKLHEAVKIILNYYQKKINDLPYTDKPLECELKKEYQSNIKNEKRELKELEKNLKKTKSDDKIKNFKQEKSKITEKYRDKQKVIFKKIAEIITKRNKEKIELIKKYYDIINEKFNVLKFSEDYSAANLLFETLNNRGRALSESDLIKNHIIKTDYSDIETVNKTWKDIKDRISNNMDPFLSDFCTMKFGPKPKKQIFRTFRDTYSSEKNIINLVDELNDCSIIYKNIIEPNTENNYWQNKEITDMLLDLKDLNAVVFRPLILFVKYKKMETSKIRDLVEMCLKIFINIKIIGKQRFEVLQKISNECFKLFDEEDDKTKDIKFNMNKIKLIFQDKYNSDHFKNLDSFTSIQNKVFIVLLKKIYFPGKQVTFQNIELEHIIPQAIYEYEDKNENKNLKEWMKILKNDENFNKELIFNLGNVALVTKEENGKLKDNVFEEKMKIYSKSEYYWTKNIKDDNNEWKSEQIKSRRNELKKQIINSWKMDEIFTS